MCKILGISGWRQSKSTIEKLKRHWIKIQKIRYSTSKDEAKRAARKELLKNDCKLYLQEAEKIIGKCKKELSFLKELTGTACAKIENYLAYAEFHVNLITRRVLNEEKIPHSDKVFSIFKPHTEWICKGKAGVSQQLGLRVCIMEDQYGFILGHKIMKKETDSDVGIPFLQEVKTYFPQIARCSFDKGFWSPGNQEACEKMQVHGVIPKKGRRSATDKQREENSDFQVARKKHAAVESGIAAIMNHGLTKCPDRSEEAFERYTAFGILGRNIQKLGAAIIEKAKSKAKRSKAIKAGLAKKKAAEKAAASKAA